MADPTSDDLPLPSIDDEMAGRLLTGDARIGRVRAALASASHVSVSVFDRNEPRI